MRQNQYLEAALKETHEQGYRIPQPEGQIVADAYKEGRLEPTDCLYIIVHLVTMCKQLELRNNELTRQLNQKEVTSQEEWTAEDILRNQG